MKWQPIPICILCASAACPALAGGGLYRITAQQVAATVTGGGVRVSPDQVSLLTEVVASVRQPRLMLKSIEPAADHLVARLECADSRECLPFLVALNVDRDALPVAAQGKNAQQSRSQTPLVRSGASAVLLLDGGHVHISIPVICLENGALGATIRAASPDRHQFYTAQVAGDHVLRGRL